jgi:apolipoprotein N-acyltransferase
LDLGGRKLAVFICFESLNARHVRDLVRQHRAEALVNLSSDGWFAEGAEPELHLALASLRAVEQARFLVRVASNGISAVVDPSGRPVHRIELNERRVQRAEIALLAGSTPYSVLGDAPWYVACAAMLGVRLFARVRGSGRLRSRVKHARM